MSLEITCDRRSLLSALSTVAKAVPANTPKPVLRNCLLTADARTGDVRLAATDMDIAIGRDVLGCKVHLAGEDGVSSGSVLLPADRLAMILKASMAPDVRIAVRRSTKPGEDGAAAIAIEAHGAKFRFALEDVALFPDLGDALPADGAASRTGLRRTVNSEALKQAIRRTAFATDPNSTRYALSGVLFEFEDAAVPNVASFQLRMVATDGRRMSVATLQADEMDGDGYGGGEKVLKGLKERNGALVVPAKSLKLLAGGLDPEETNVVVEFPDANSVRFRNGLTVLRSRLVEGRFPRWRDILPPSPKLVVAMGCRPLRETIELASVTKTQLTTGLDLEIKTGELAASSAASEIGESTASMEVDYDGDPLSVSLAPDYVLEMLKSLPDEAALRMEICDPKTPIGFRLGESGNEFLHVVMPLVREE